jgi:large subunit ribosomal protein L13Ae
VIGRLATEYGWKYGEVVKTLEEKRKEKARAYYEVKQKKVVARRQALQSAEAQEVSKTLEVLGF